MHINTSANKIADFILAKTPARRRAVVRQVMRAQTQQKGYAPYYSAFGGPAKEFLQGGARDAGIINRAVSRLAKRATGNPSTWMQIDTRITREALVALGALAPTIQSLGVRFVQRSSSRKGKLSFPDITVTVTPDIMVRGERNDVPLIGGARFYLAKESTYQLGQRGAELVATMQFLWCAESGSGRRTADPSLCMVLECIQRRITVAPDDVSANLRIIQRGCREFVSMWNQLLSEEAA